MIEKFIYDEWVPTFVENLLNQKEVNVIVEEIMRRGDKELLVAFIEKIAPKIVEYANEQRNEMYFKMQDE